MMQQLLDKQLFGGTINESNAIFVNMIFYILLIIIFHIILFTQFCYLTQRNVYKSENLLKIHLALSTLENLFKESKLIGLRRKAF